MPTVKLEFECELIGQTGALSPRIAITASEDDTKEDDNAV